MNRLLIAILFFSTSSFGQAFMKSGIGSTALSGIASEAEIGYRKGVHQGTIGYFYNPGVNKAFYSIRYGYWYKDFVFYGGVGIVNRFFNYGYVQVFGTYVLGAEYNTRDILQNTNFYFGSDVTGKDFNIKGGIRIKFQ